MLNNFYKSTDKKNIKKRAFAFVKTRMIIKAMKKLPADLTISNRPHFADPLLFEMFWNVCCEIKVTLLDMEKAWESKATPLIK